MPNNIRTSLKMMLKRIQVSEPSITFPIEMNPSTFRHDQKLFIAPEDVIQFGTMVEIVAPCIVLYKR